jgi:surface carbohydrate biosynthesis protein (TIGR04326 family)
VYCRLPQFLQALLSFNRLLRASRPFRKAATSGWYAGDLSLLICGYFANVVPEEAATGHFHSRYWENLQGLMKELGIKGNWLHHNAASSFDTALAWVQDFNQNSQDQGFHSFLGAYFSWRLLFRVLKRWFWLRFKYWQLYSVENVFLVPGTCLSMWPLMKGHWKTSLLGAVAISNLFSVELFDAAMRDLPRQIKGLYLFEGNSWERAMIHAWRKYGHGQLIAVAHATVRFWDLAYYADPQTVRSSAPYSMPQPDRIALNGKASVEAYHIVAYPKESLVECEALRYGYLRNFSTESVKKRRGDMVNVLIVGDFLLSSTIRLLRLIEAAMPHLAGYFTYTIKPHPVCPVLAKDFPLLDLTLVTDPLGKILQKFDIVCSSNATTAAVDAYFAGLPVVVILEGDELNISPLRGQAGVFFVSTPKELAEALQTPELWAVRNPDPNEFFFLDPDLPRWRHLLSSASEC